LIEIASKTAEKNSAQSNRQTDRQTDRHYENNGHLAVNQKQCYVQVLHSHILAALLQVLQQRASAKLCGVVHGMELRNFCRRRHLYSAGRPWRWASAHILVSHYMTL